MPVAVWEKLMDFDTPFGEVKLKLYVWPDVPGGIVKTIYLGFIDTTTIGMFPPVVLRDILL